MLDHQDLHHPREKAQSENAPHDRRTPQCGQAVSQGGDELPAPCCLGGREPSQQRFNDTEEFFQKAGLWRISKACLPESEDFRAAFCQRMPREAGKLFNDYVAKANEMGDLEPDRLARLQDSVVMAVMGLSENGRISSRWIQLAPVLNDPDYVAKMKAAEEEEAKPPAPAPEPEGAE